jgi:catechol 2,3-dioxygenase-like lactoylglutathione lyase family enzyme
MTYTLSPHIAIQVTDFEKALEFYQKVLGMEIVERRDDETSLQCGPITFHVENSRNGHTFFEFEVEDAEKAREELEAAGCRTTPTHLERSYLVADPFGLKFHVWEKGEKS